MLCWVSVDLYTHTHTHIHTHSLTHTHTTSRGGQLYNLDLINPEMKKKKKKYQNSGTLNLEIVK